MATPKSGKSKIGRVKKVHLIISDEKSPSVQVKQGMRLDVISVKLVDPSLRKSKASAARLCGGTNTCLALIEL